MKINRTVPFSSQPYDSNTGRYVTEDPIGLDGGINIFTYVDNNPLLDVDSFGLCKCCEFASVADGMKIAAEAKKWVGTKYLSGGDTKNGADCSNSTRVIYNNVGLSYTNKRLSAQPTKIPDDQFSEKSTNCKMQIVTQPQIGDVVKWPRHMAIYDPTIGTSTYDNNKKVPNVMWSARREGIKYGAAPLEWWKAQGSPTYYRYCKKVSPD
ncbi:MAG: NlpC/P60 family protein [Deltaproteobacteria bacterium]|nr:NlpC/P60 family protein [Deltaproteobacteria bacterium]